MFHTKLLEKIRTNILCSLTPPPPHPRPKSCRLCDNVERHGREVEGTDDNKTRRKRIACWTPKATHTHTHSEYVILIAFPLKQRLC